MSPHATDWHRGCKVAAGRLRSVGGIRPACANRNDSRPKRHETAHEAVEEKCGELACKQSFRGAVVVQHTCAQVMLIGVGGGGSQTAQRNHLSFHVAVASIAQQSGQWG